MWTETVTPCIPTGYGGATGGRQVAVQTGKLSQSWRGLLTVVWMVGRSATVTFGEAPIQVSYTEATFQNKYFSFVKVNLAQKRLPVIIATGLLFHQ